MSCCDSGAKFALRAPNKRATGDEVLLASRVVADGVRQTDLSVPTVHCGACIRAVEMALGALAGVESARVNLSTRRVTVRWRSKGPPPSDIFPFGMASSEASTH
jgi:Cu2+-exporting ATPase